MLVVGPSGAGKDTVLRQTKERVTGDRRFFFATRVVTREANSSEDHHSLTRADFEAELGREAFALHWRAHGHCYAIPAAVDDVVSSGRIVIVNASRGAVLAARQRYASVATVLIDAPPEIRMRRLALRSRETPADIQARLARVVAGFSCTDVDLSIDNSGTPEAAAEQLSNWLERLSSTMGPSSAAG